jgi:hypothetical protein
LSYASYCALRGGYVLPWKNIALCCLLWNLHQSLITLDVFYLPLAGQIGWLENLTDISHGRGITMPGAKQADEPLLLVDDTI